MFETISVITRTVPRAGATLLAKWRHSSFLATGWGGFRRDITVGDYTRIIRRRGREVFHISRSKLLGYWYEYIHSRFLYGKIIN